MSSLGSQSACRASAVVLLILYLAQLVLCAVVRPFTTLFSHEYALFTLALITIAAACQVWYLFGSVASGVDLVALSRLLIAAAVCDIVVSGVSILKSLIDAVDVLRACRRHITVMFPMLVVKTSSEEIHPKPLAEDTWNNSDAVIISEIKSPLLSWAMQSVHPCHATTSRQTHQMRLNKQKTHQQREPWLPSSAPSTILMMMMVQL